MSVEAGGSTEPHRLFEGRAMRRCVAAAAVAWAAVASQFVPPALAQAGAAAPAPVPVATQAPSGAGTSLTLGEALRHALAHYPSVRAAIEEVGATRAGVDVARAAFLPRLDSVWQTNRATVNNVTGALFPQSTVLPISGPPLPTVSGRSVWGSAAGALFSWEPLDFGLRQAGVLSAEAAVTRARAGEELTRLEVQGAVGEAFLAVAVAQRAVIAAQADVDRRVVLARVARVLVESELRAGAEASRAEAERAAASTRLAQARQGLALAQVTLWRVLGPGLARPAVQAEALFTTVPARASSPQGQAATHPLALVREAAVAEARAREDAVAKAFAPRLFLQSSVFARGSGADPSGVLRGGADGLGLERANWAAGLQVVFPNVFDRPSLKARQAAAAATTRAEIARLDEAAGLVTSRQQAAAAMVEAARAVAAETPTLLDAARQTEAQARARYEAGLTGIVEVAEAQNLLAQAEVQHQIARADVWRAELAEAIAHGSMESFLALVAAAGAQ